MRISLGNFSIFSAYCLEVGWSQTCSVLIFILLFLYKLLIEYLVWFQEKSRAWNSFCCPKCSAAHLSSLLAFIQKTFPLPVWAPSSFHKRTCMELFELEGTFKSGPTPLHGHPELDQIAPHAVVLWLCLSTPICLEKIMVKPRLHSVSLISQLWSQMRFQLLSCICLSWPQNHLLVVSEAFGLSSNQTQ